MFKGKKIGVLMGGTSEERGISLKTGGAVLKALIQRGYDAVAVDAGADLPARLVSEKIDVAFIALHGRRGEDGCVQGMLEVMGIPYTGSGVQSSSLCMDKAAAKKIMSFHGIRTPEFEMSGPSGLKKLKPPVVVKPNSQGSAIGVTIVREKGRLKDAIAEAQRHCPAGFNAVLIERFIEGREMTVSILNGRVLPVIEIKPKDGFYDFAHKYTKGLTDFIVPARVNKVILKKTEKEALGAYNALRCSGAARVDVMLDDKGAAYVLEVNTVPGLTEMSLFPRAAEIAGMDYPALVEAMLESAGLDK
ncbi:MAG: D-alanine--D-alanine ligase [Deltaproteobacteria bacterium]|nr:D-alanine--D-alanine ligase [Deltaproteobacteria bacterium]